jgi:hypothetical protein
MTIKNKTYKFKFKESSMRRIIFFFLSFMLVFSAQAQSLKLDKIEYKPGESVKVHFSTPANLPANAWVGIIPSTVPHGSESENDKHDLAYQYLGKKTSGTLTFTAPNSPGLYDFRMNDSDSNGKEIATVSFSVGGSSYGSLRLEKYNYQPNNEIKVHFVASASFQGNAWVGIIPSGVPHGSEGENDKHDLSYQYLSKKTAGTLIFKAPAKPGLYDFRMNDTDNNGKEVTYVTFSVK